MSEEILRTLASPVRNWGRWGTEDEIGHPRPDRGERGVTWTRRSSTADLAPQAGESN